MVIDYLIAISVPALTLPKHYAFAIDPYGSNMRGNSGSGGSIGIMYTPIIFILSPTLNFI